MAIRNMKAVLRLRRDSENNLNRSNLILLDGEVAIADTPFNGKRIKIGDGLHRFSELQYENMGILTEGLLVDDSTMKYPDNSTTIDPNNHLLFLDRNTGGMYYWNGDQYVYINRQIAELPIASDTVQGILKLYDTIEGQNTDGAVTQRAVNEAFNKVQVAANNVAWRFADNDDEMLVSDFSTLQNLDVFN